MQIVNCEIGAIVHNKELHAEECKVLVVEEYKTKGLEDDPDAEEFKKGAFLRINKIMLRNLTCKKNDGSKKKERAHKRGCSPDKSTKTKRKKMRNLAKAYISSSSNKIACKKFVNLVCSCRYKDCQKLSEDARNKAHRDFWMIGDYDRQNAVLLTLVKTVDKATTKCPKKAVKSKPRSRTRQCTINGIDVCRKSLKLYVS